ncbi:MAG: helix-turn-helix domain-containing protein [Candidatus Paceibacterota bacterium]
MYEKILQEIGLNKKEAIVYQTLLETGPIEAREILKKVAQKISTTRSNLYNILAALKEKKLATEKVKKGKNLFEAESPTKLLKVIEESVSKTNQAQQNLAMALPELTSLYNLTTQKPVVQFYEGIEGVKKVLADSLTSKNIVYTYADMEAVVKYIDKVNQEYAKERDRLGIQKKAVIIDSKFSRNYLKNYHQETTDIRLIDHLLYPIKSLMEIYEGKISYITLSEKGMIGVIIEDPNIYQLNKSIFEYVWATAKDFDHLPPFSSSKAQ